MGNGPGNIKEYIDAFYAHPRLQGGLAWEWANHGLLTRDKNTGEEFYGYGGDFGEAVHDSTFVMDGLLNSDHSPTPGLIEYKKAIEPVQLLKFKDMKAEFVNRYDIVTLNHLTCHYSFTLESGRESTAGSLDIPPGIDPGQTFQLDIPLPPECDGEVLLNISFRLKSEAPYLEKGFEVANAQIGFPFTRLRITPSMDDSLEIRRPGPNILQVHCEDTTWTFNTLHGHLTSWTASGTELISQPPELNFFRAPTDNDMPKDGQDWKDRLLHLATPSTRKVKWTQQSPSSVVITSHKRVAPPVLSWSIDCVWTYTFHSNGSLRIHASGTPRGENLPRTLPRIGLVLALPHSFQCVEWFGRGPGESYRDSKFSQAVGRWAVSAVDELWTDYEVPQESSNRTDTRWVRLSNGEKALVAQFVDAEEVDARRLFDFQASHYEMRDVAASNHPYELRKKKREDVILRLDACHHGLGTGSCGPKTLDKYALFTREFQMELLLQCE